MDLEEDDDLLIPLVLWNESPKVEITCMHVHYLPIFQPSSQNSNSSSRFSSISSSNTTPRASFTGIITSLASQYRSALQGQQENDDDDDEDQYQVCVFAGTIDGMILYWLFEQEKVQSLSILMPNGCSSSNSSGGKSNAVMIQGIVCGIDEWGQSMMVSITKDGALAQWQLPNGVCSYLNNELLREIAPIKGMQMFCNKRYAMVYSEESRMIALDTWKMTLLYCIDTAQEQVRRSLAVGEIKFMLRGTNQYHTYRPTASTTSSTSSGDNATASGITSSAASGSPMLATKAVQPINTSTIAQVWDSIVLSLGAEGLVKCFLWSKPRGGASGGSGPGSNTTTASIGSTGSSGTYQWYQESCWILSWADDAEDITCSQSTSLKDGDNMNPQSALMRSIKNSYFPIGLKLSSNCSLILFIWGTRWAVLQRQWLCQLGPSELVQLKSRPGLGGQAGQGGASCRVPPGVFLGLDDLTSVHQQKTASSSGRRRGYTFCENSRGSHDMKSSGVRWVDGDFVDETHVLLWTNTGHVIQFDLTAATSPNGGAGQGSQPNGQLFIFTKDIDQFVPRSNYKPLGHIERGQFVSFLQQCACCSSTSSSSTTTIKSSYARHVMGGTRASGGLTSCIIQKKQPRLGLVHVCRRGSVGFWHGDIVPKYVSSPRNTANLPLVLPIDKYQKIKFNSIADGYEERIVAEESIIHRRRRRRKRPSVDTKTKEKEPDDDKITIAHLILGRDQCRTSAVAFEGSGTSSIRNTCTNYSGVVLGGMAATSGSSGPPVVEKRSWATLGSSMSLPAPLSATATQRPSSPSPLAMALAGEVVKHLQDVPLLAIGYKDGSIEFSLLKDPLKGISSSNIQLEKSEDDNTYSTVYCHQSKVTCIAHCNWISLPTLSLSSTTATSPVQETTPPFGPGTTGALAPPVPISIATAHRRTSSDTNVIANAQAQGTGHYMSMKKARNWKCGVPVEESGLATDRNPFYRPSFSSQVAALTGNKSNSRTVSPVSSPTSSGSTTMSNGKMSFLVFTGASNGSMCIVEVVLRHHFYGSCDKEEQPSLDQRFVLETRVVGRFKQHVDTIVQICISPALREEDKLVACIGKDRKVSIYAPSIVYPLAQTKNQVAIVEWECILELCDHGDTIVGLEWHLEMGLLYVECTDTMMYIWNLDTGILERTVPISLLHHPIERNWIQPASHPFNTIYPLSGIGQVQVQMASTNQLPRSKKEIRQPVECKSILIGGKASVHICKYFIQRSAEHIKKTWKTHFYAVNVMASSFLKTCEQTIQQNLSQNQNQNQMEEINSSGGSRLKIQIPSTSTTNTSGSSSYDSSLISPSPYAIGSMEMILFSFLLSWDADSEIDRACMDLLGLAKPKWLYSCALMGSAGALTVPVPWKMHSKQNHPQPPPPPQQRPTSPSSTRSTSIKSNLTVATSDSPPPLPPVVIVDPESPAFYRHWQHSSALTAHLSLGIVSLCMNLMEHKFSIGCSQNPSVSCASPRNKEAFQLLWSQLITQQTFFLPDHVAFYREPSLEILAKYGFASCEYTQLASRLLLNAVIKRLDTSVRSALTAEYAAKLHFEIVKLETETNSKILSTSTSSTMMGGSLSIHSSSSNSSSSPHHHSSVGGSSSSSTTGGTSGGPGGSSNVHLMTTLIDGSLVVKRLGPLVMLLSIIGTCFPGEISPAGAREVCDILVYLLKSPRHKVANVAAQLLTKGLLLFRPHLVDLSSLIYQLLMIDAREKELVSNNTGTTGATTTGSSTQSSSSSTSTGTTSSQLPLRGSNNSRTVASSNAAMNLLVELGACESAFVLTLLQQEINHTDRSQAYRECILIFLTELINTHFLLMFRHLPAIVDTIMCCLDPTKPERRKRCLELSTKCLHQLVRRFPMVDFHRETQRLAIGTMEAVILIYDLRTATKWRVFDGHTSAISAVCFRSDGQMLVSYAAREASVRWWNSGNAGIFGGMLKMQQTCLKEHKLDVIRQDWSVGSTGGGFVSSFGMSMGVGGGGNVTGAVASAADLKQVIQTCRFQFVTLKDKKIILRLTREDASQVQFQL